ncbi:MULTISPECIES: hypothetical protein [unclassified Microcoleus]|nr:MULTISPECIES: hypothetical protein [unclassified Microcoleus]
MGARSTKYWSIKLVFLAWGFMTITRVSVGEGGDRAIAPGDFFSV